MNHEETKTITYETLQKENLEIVSKQQKLCKVNYSVNLDVVKFPDLIYTAEGNIVSTYTNNVSAHQLNDPYFFSRLIEDGFNKIHTSTMVGDVILYLFTKEVPFLNDVMKHLGYGITGCTHEELIHILYLSLNLGVDVNIDLNLRNFIVLNNSKTITETYKKETGNDWAWCSDKATIIWMLYNACSLPICRDYTQCEKYKHLLNMPKMELYKLCRYIYPTCNPFYSPIRYICSVNFSPLEKYIYSEETQLWDLAISVQFIPVTLINNDETQLYDNINDADFIEKLYNSLLQMKTIVCNLFLSEVYMYKHLICKSETKDETNIIYQTDLQLLRKYKPPLMYKNRIELIQCIKQLSTKLHWRVNHVYNSTNIDFNLFNLEKRTHTTSDPLLSWGTLCNYRTYNLEELVHSWKDGVLYYPDRINDTEVMPYQALYDLEKIVKNNIQLENIKNILHNRKYVLEQCKQRYNNLTKDAKVEFQSWLYEVFLCGMWTRFWKGHSYPFPNMWTKNYNGESHTLREVKTNESFTRLKLIKNQCVLLLCNDLPRITYNWITGNYTIGMESLYSVLTIVADGNFCLSNWSNIALQTSYFLLKYICDINDFNTGLQEYDVGIIHTFNIENFENSTHVDLTLQLNEYTH